MKNNREIYKLDLSPKAKCVYMYLRDRANSEGKCFPAIKTIASELNIGKTTVKRALNELATNGIISKEERFRENGGNSSNLYTLL
ncbi:helix-turn-helix domain-containing protein [Tyzzerella sp. OttesenSCG-928-J15]|nr:helix-turn-helix domain-containing protein [Tyzzerella sp. OttesenSCG-928-J15]